MKEIKQIDLNSWNEYKTRIISDLFPGAAFKRGIYLFRGQGSDTYSLISSFDRWYKGTRQEKFKIAEKLLKQFMKECEGENLPKEVHTNDLLMLSLAQHNGLPTRMLDWSESPYVAAFFAFSGHLTQGLTTDNKVAVYVLDASDHIWHKENGCEILDVPSFGNERIRNQHGKFTYLRTPHDTLEEYTLQACGESVTALKKYTIPAKDVGKAMADLDSMGLNYSRIYPGLNGNSKAAEVRVLLGMLK